MAVFMSPRTNYVLGRFRAHSVMSYWFTLWVVVTALFVVTEPLKPQSLLFFGVGGYTLATKKGRGVAGRCTRECFYGVLNGFTGVCSVNERDEVGGGGSAVDGD